jgi:UDP-N-acetylmuramyl pentapeptide synthase
VLKLKDTIRAGDVILVDGSKEIKMSEIVDQIRKIW